MTALSLRPAVTQDAKLIFKWRNDPWIIKKGSLNKTVTWEEHENWFLSLIDDPLRHMFIIEVDNVPAGQVRFVSMNDNTMAEISIYLMQNFINKGLGVRALKNACEQVTSYLNINHVIAYILEKNQQSEKAFVKADFKLLGDFKNIDVPALENHLIYVLEV